MTPEDEALADTIADVVQAAIAPIFADLKMVQASLGSWELRWNDLGALRERMAVLELRTAIPGPAGAAGRDGIDGKDGKDGMPGLHGTDGAPGLHGKDGIDGKDGAPGLHGKDGIDGKDGAPGLHGKDGDAGRNGIDGAPGLHGTDGLAGLNGTDGRDGVNGKDGADIVQGLIDREGNLIFTLSNGSTKTVGLVVGRDGRDGTDGRPGRDLDLEQVREFITKDLATWPKPKDGKDGAPGLSPDDFDWEFNADTRELSIILRRDGKIVSERTKKLVGIRIYRGVYEAGKTYDAGDDASWDGSLWTATATTSERPGNGATPWKMTVKHGEKGPKGQDGKPGRDGKDLTQMDGTGRKWGI